MKLFNLSSLKAITVKAVEAAVFGSPKLFSLDIRSPFSDYWIDLAVKRSQGITMFYSVRLFHGADVVITECFYADTVNEIKGFLDTCIRDWNEQNPIGQRNQARHYRLATALTDQQIQKFDLSSNVTHSRDIVFREMSDKNGWLYGTFESQTNSVDFFNKDLDTGFTHCFSCYRTTYHLPLWAIQCDHTRYYIKEEQPEQEIVKEPTNSIVENDDNANNIKALKATDIRKNMVILIEGEQHTVKGKEGDKLELVSSDNTLYISESIVIDSIKSGAYQLVQEEQPESRTLSASDFTDNTLIDVAGTQYWVTDNDGETITFKTYHVNGEMQVNAARLITQIEEGKIKLICLRKFIYSVEYTIEINSDGKYYVSHLVGDIQTFELETDEIEIAAKAAQYPVGVVKSLYGDKMPDPNIKKVLKAYADQYNGDVMHVAKRENGNYQLTASLTVGDEKEIQFVTYNGEAVALDAGFLLPERLAEWLQVANIVWNAAEQPARPEIKHGMTLFDHYDTYDRFDVVDVNPEDDELVVVRNSNGETETWFYYATQLGIEGDMISINDPERTHEINHIEYTFTMIDEDTAKIVPPEGCFFSEEVKQRIFKVLKDNNYYNFGSERRITVRQAGKPISDVVKLLPQELEPVEFMTDARVSELNATLPVERDAKLTALQKLGYCEHESMCFNSRVVAIAEREQPETNDKWIDTVRDKTNNRAELVIIRMPVNDVDSFTITSRDVQPEVDVIYPVGDNLFKSVESVLVELGAAHNVTRIDELRKCGKSIDYKVVYNKNIERDLSTDNNNLFPMTQIKHDLNVKDVTELMEYKGRNNKFYKRFNTRFGGHILRVIFKKEAYDINVRVTWWSDAAVKAEEKITAADTVERAIDIVLHTLERWNNTELAYDLLHLVHPDKLQRRIEEANKLNKEFNDDNSRTFSVFKYVDLDNRFRLGVNSQPITAKVGDRFHVDHGVGINKNQDGEIIWMPERIKAGDILRKVSTGNEHIIKENEQGFYIDSCRMEASIIPFSSVDRIYKLLAKGTFELVKQGE